MKNYAFLSIIAILPFLFFACSDDSEVDSSQDNVMRVYSTAIAASSNAITLASQADTNYLDVVINGPGGGTCHIAGSITTEEDTNHIAFNLEFNNFCSEGVTLNGDVSMDGTMILTGSTYYYIMEYNGDCIASGDVTGTCSWELTMVMDENGYSVTGTITLNGTTYDIKIP